MDITMWGGSHKSKVGIFRRWSSKGISQLKHLWDPERQIWLNIANILRFTRTYNLTRICQTLIHSIPWCMSQNAPPQEGDWYTFDEPQRALLEEFYHIMIGRRTRPLVCACVQKVPGYETAWECFGTNSSTPSIWKTHTSTDTPYSLRHLPDGFY